MTFDQRTFMKCAFFQKGVLTVESGLTLIAWSMFKVNVYRKVPFTF